MDGGKFILELPSGGECECAIRISKRCRRMSLRLLRNGLELVVPSERSAGKAREFAVRNAAWAEKALKRRETSSAGAEPRPQEADSPFPEYVELKAQGLRFPVELRDAPELDFLSVRLERGGQLVIQGDLKKKELCFATLRDWVKGRALKHFREKVAEISTELGLRCASVKVRDQKARWGTCTGRGGIILNYRLLLLEPRFLRHVIVHELCHTERHDHSKEFWRLVERFDPDAERLKEELNKAARNEIPAWAVDGMEL